MKRTADTTKEKTRDLFEIVKLHKYEKGTLRAFVSVRIENVIITNCKLVEIRDDWHLEMPQEAGKDGKWYNTVFVDYGNKEDNKEVYDTLTKLAVEAYDKA